MNIEVSRCIVASLHFFRAPDLCDMETEPFSSSAAILVGILPWDVTRPR
jgi:hypothetical protein